MNNEVEMGNIGEGGCPCGEVEMKGYWIRSHCWRTHNCCRFSGVHYKAKKGFEKEAKAHAKAIAEYIEDAWLTEVKVTSKPIQ